MALTAAGNRLTASYRREQLAIRARALRRILALWGLLDVRRLDQTTPEWLRASTQAVVEHRREAARSAATYYEQFRAVELPHVEPYRARVVDDLPVDETPIRMSLAFTGPETLRRKTARLAGLAELESQDVADRELDRVRVVAANRVAGAAGRHVLNGGREVLREEGARDRQVVAFARISDGDPCYFCALMISRGFVYRSRESAGRSANDRFVGDGLYKFHDRCACTVEPVFDRDAPVGEQEARYKAVYAKAKANARRSGEPVLSEFRWLIEGRDRPATRRTTTKATGSRSAARELPDRRRVIEAQIAALEPTFDSLTARLAAGEPVQEPHRYQKTLLARLRKELASL